MKKMAGLVKVSHVLLIGLVLGVAASAVYAQYQRDPPQQQWGGYDGGNWEELQKQRQEVLKKIPVDPDVLVNVTYELMPSTP